jgi:hypothetical protein
MGPIGGWVVLDRSDDVALSAAIADDGGVFTDETDDANDAGANDVILLPAGPQIDDAFYFGYTWRFTELTINIGVASSASSALTWEYYDGSSWVALSGVSDNTDNFQNSSSNTVTWNLPWDWAKTTVNSQGPFYYVRARSTVAGGSQVFGTQCFIGDGPVDVDEPVRGMLAWRANDSVPFLAFGTASYLFNYAQGTLGDITPRGITTGGADAVLSTGNYGDGAYGSGAYGTGNPAVATVTEAQTWQLDNFGEDLVALAYADGRLYTWDKSIGVGPISVAVSAAIADDGGVFTDETADANSAAANDVQVLPVAPVNGDAFYLGYSTRFASITVNIGTVATDGAVTWEYWNGSSWTALAGVSDGTSGFTVGGAQTVSWTMPSDWATTTVNSQGPYLYVRARVSTAGTSQALGTQMFITAGFAAQITNAPTGCRGVVVTPEGFVVALGASGSLPTGASGDRREVVWSDQRNMTLWEPASTNQAGAFVLSGAGELVAGRRSRAETLLWTTVDLFAMRYIGGVLVYSFQQVGAQCGAISRMAMAMVDGRAYWMGHSSFFVYDGFVNSIPSDVSDFVFGDINQTQISKVCAITLAEKNTITWHYPSAGSTENDRYVSHNWKTKHWEIGALQRTSGVDRDAFDYPMAGDAGGVLYDHERGLTYLDENGNALTPYAESGPIEIGQGDQVMEVVGIIPDEKTLGDVVLKLYTSLYPTDAETLSAAFTAANPTDVRLQARQVRLRLDQVSTNWRFGTPRLMIEAGGRR